MLVKEKDLEQTKYVFVLENGEEVEVAGNGKLNTTVRLIQQQIYLMHSKKVITGSFKNGEIKDRN